MKKFQIIGYSLSKKQQMEIRGGDLPGDQEPVYKYICENSTEEHTYSPEVTIGICRHDVRINCSTTHGDCYYESTHIFV